MKSARVGDKINTLKYRWMKKQNMGDVRVFVGGIGWYFYS